MLHTLITLLLFFLPGWTLINAVFPRKGDLDKHYDALYRLIISIVVSVSLLVVYGFLLNLLGKNPDTGNGYFTSENLWLGLSALTGFLFVLGWLRGSYPLLGRLHPSLARHPTMRPSEADEPAFETIRKLEQLGLERDGLLSRRRRLRRAVIRGREGSRAMEGAELSEIEKRLREIDNEMRSLEIERSREME